MLHASLWQQSGDMTQRLREYPFVRGLADGTLDRDVFRRYVAQDAFFLSAFLKAYALAAAKCDDFERAGVFHNRMTGVLDELKLHGSYSATLGIDLDDVEPYTATTAYTDFLLRVAGDDFGLLCARLESLLDEIASNSPAVHDAYRYAMQCELDFFSAPLESAP